VGRRCTGASRCLAKLARMQLAQTHGLLANERNEACVRSRAKRREGSKAEVGELVVGRERKVGGKCCKGVGKRSGGGAVSRKPSRRWRKHGWDREERVDLAAANHE